MYFFSRNRQSSEGEHEEIEKHPPRPKKKLYVLIAAGVLGVIVVALALGLGTYFGLRNRQSSSDSAESSNTAGPTSPDSTSVATPTSTSSTGADSDSSDSDDDVANSLQGPVNDNNFPDPCYIEVNNTYYAFATNRDKEGTKQINVQFATSTDFKNWTVTGDDVLPDVGSWSSGKNIWAPDVVQVDDGTFVLYYTAAHVNNTDIHCLSAATSDKVEGPYKPVNDKEALICPLKLGGAIDPEGFKDEDGKRYLLYKIDGNSLNRPNKPLNPTPIMLQEVEDDGHTLIGEPIQILDRAEEDGPLIEAPSLGRYNSTKEGDPIYILFYSSNIFSTDQYDVSYATSDKINGTYTRSEERLMRTGHPNDDLVGPGGMDTGVSGNKVVFHSTERDSQINGGLTRNMWTAEITVNGTKVTL